MFVTNGVLCGYTGATQRNSKLSSPISIKHDEASRRNISTAECQSVMLKEQQDPMWVAYERCNRDLEPQLGRLQSFSAGVVFVFQRGGAAP